ncbi:hypothetical protein Tco_1432282 [Tanacetum coccineum]
MGACFIHSVCCHAVRIKSFIRLFRITVVVIKVSAAQEERLRKIYSIGINKWYQSLCEALNKKKLYYTQDLLFQEAMDSQSTQTIKLPILQPENGNAPIVTKTVDGKETAIENRFRGKTAIKKTQKNLLKQQYENYAASSTEVIDQTYERLQKLISQLNKPEIETLSLDDLFNNLKAYESEVKGTSSSTTNSHNVAFLSSSSTNSATRAVNVGN